MRLSKAPHRSYSWAMCNLRKTILLVFAALSLFATADAARAQAQPGTAVTIAGGQSPSDDLVGRYTQVRGYWVDTSRLMWAGKDSGRDMSWHKAMEYCQSLRLAGYSDWRLPTIYELQSIYDGDLEAPGRAGPGAGRPFSWHVEGGLFLTGHEWSSSRGLDDHEHPSGSPWYFDFNEGKKLDFDDPSSGKRALCVRGSER